MSNTLAMYRTIKRLGIPDSNILLMLGDDVSCNARNVFPAKVYANAGKQMDLYGDGIEVDYRGYEVTVESFLRLLTGRQPSYTPRNKRLLSDASSNVFIYMTGHGGNEFLKFQDNEEVSAFDIADAIEQMWEKRRFNRLLYLIDTCQANTMYSKFYSPNIISSGSSALGENSYSHHNDMEIGTAVIDSFTHEILHYLETITKSSKATLQDFFSTYDPAKIKSHPGISTELSRAQPSELLVTDFFGGVASVEVTPREKELPFSSGRNVLQPTCKTGRVEVPEVVQKREDVVNGWEASDWDAPLASAHKASLPTGVAAGVILLGFGYVLLSPLWP
jgi:phosphatidylinositol glycan class K